MPHKDEARHTRKLMIMSMLIVFGVVAVVILAFHLLHRNDQQEVAAATEEGQGTIGQMTSGVNEYKIDSTETTELPIEDGTVTQQDGQRKDPKGSADELYLVAGDDKSTSPYGKIAHISYSNTVVYTDELLEKLQPDGLRITRNEIFARHGRMFNDQRLQDYFNLQSWYVARYSPEAFDDTCLNQVERDNVTKILEYEQKNSANKDLTGVNP